MSTWLVAVPASHPCAAVETALRLKGVRYRRVDLVPVLHKALQRVLFGGSTVPGVRFDDGERVLGSRAILRALDARVPEPVLVPGPDAEAAEQWGDEVLQPVARRLVWAALRRAPRALPSYCADAHPPVPAFLARLVGPLVTRAEVLIHGASPAATAADLAALDGHLDVIDAWVADGTLGGASPNAADLQIGSAVRLLLTLETLVPRIDARPSGVLARRWFPDYPGHVAT